MTKGYYFTKSLAETSKNLFTSISGKIGLSHTSLLTEWKNIVGEDLAKSCFPYFVKTDFLTKEATLFVVSNDEAFKAMFTYHRALLTSKINLYFGGSLINDVKLKYFA